METIRDVLESLKEFDPNLRLLVETDDLGRSTHDIVGIRQVSADYVKIDVRILPVPE